jgi:hypothetical protein
MAALWSPEVTLIPTLWMVVAMASAFENLFEVPARAKKCHRGQNPSFVDWGYESPSGEHYFATQ